MRLPRALREPPEIPRTWWIAGAGVMVILLFVALAMPWHQGEMRRVPDSALPRPRYHGREWGGLCCLGAGGYAEVSVGADGVTGVSESRLEDWLRDETPSFCVRAHRAAPWSAVAPILASAVRAGRRGLGIQVGPWHYLHLVLVTEPAPPEEGLPPPEEITIAAIPLADPEGALAARRERQKAGREAPIIHLAFTGDPGVEGVVHALECYAGYAGDDATVRLAVQR